MDEKLLVELTTQLVSSWMQGQQAPSAEESSKAFATLFETILEKYRKEIEVKQELGAFFPLVEDDSHFDDELDEGPGGPMIAELIRFPDDDDDGNGGMYQ